MLIVPVDFANGLTIDALADSGAYVRAISQNAVDKLKQQAPANVFKIEDPPNYQIQVANSHLKEPLATVTLKFALETLVLLNIFW